MLPFNISFCCIQNKNKIFEKNNLYSITSWCYHIYLIIIYNTNSKYTVMINGVWGSFVLLNYLNGVKVIIIKLSFQFQFSHSVVSD